MMQFWRNTRKWVIFIVCENLTKIASFWYIFVWRLEQKIHSKNDAKNGYAAFCRRMPYFRESECFFGNGLSSNTF
jgi:hypothetical protein